MKELQCYRPCLLRSSSLVRVLSVSFDRIFIDDYSL